MARYQNNLSFKEKYTEVISTERVKVLHIALLVSGITTFLLGIQNYLQGAMALSASLVAFSMFCAVGIYLNRNGMFTISAYFFIATLYLITSFSLYDGAGLNDPGVAVFTVLIFISAFLLGRSGLWASLTASVITILTLFFGHHLGWFELNISPTLNRTITLIIIYTGSAGFSWGILNGFRNVVRELEENEDRFEKLFYESPVPIMIGNTGLEPPQIILVNEEFEKVSGFDRTELEGQSGLELGLWRKETRDQVSAAVLDNGKLRNHQISWKDKAGNLGTALVFIEPIEYQGTPKWVFSFIDTTEREKSITQINRQLKELSSIDLISKSALLNNDLDEIIESVTKIIGNDFFPDHFGVLLIDFETGKLSPHKSYVGLSAEDLDFEIPLGAGVVGLVAESGRSSRIDDTSEFKGYIPAKSGPFLSELCVPIIVDEKVIGVMNAERKEAGAFKDEDERLLNSVSIQTAIAIKKILTYLELEKASQDLSSAYESTLEGWSRAMDLRDHETEGHTQRVTNMTLTLASALQYPEEKMDSLRHGSLLHDIGKIGIPDSILLKPGSLDDGEWEIMKQHPRLAEHLLKGIPFLKDAIEIPLYHHERWDGSGYPEGLEKDNIPYGARIFAVIDVYDALIHDRPYRQAWSKQKTLNFISKNTGILFDPSVTEAFHSIIS